MMSAGAGSLAAKAAAESSDEIVQGASETAQSAFDSTGFNVALVVIVLAVALVWWELVSTATNAADEAVDGVGDAGAAAGETVGSIWE